MLGLIDRRVMLQPDHVVHLGLGNFHRAHQAVYTADAPGQPWQITAVARSNRALVDALRAQGMRYTVMEVGPDAALPRSMDVITDALVGNDEPAAVVEALASERTAVVTLTVTEKGYGYRPGTHDLDVTEAVLADASDDGGPRTTIGFLGRGLLRRAEHGAPVNLVSCDNVGGNGALLGRLLHQYAELLPAADRDRLTGYLDMCVATPNTMVDRIVPATTDAHRRAVAAAGIADQVPVPCEPFTMWVLEDAFTAPRPAWEQAGATLTGEVHAYELVKLRLLNATNSFLAYSGLLSGKTYIAEAVTDEAVRTAAWRLGDEMQPTLVLPAGLDPHAYRTTMFERFGNIALGHTCRQVGEDGSIKLAQRVPGPVAWHAERGDVPPVTALLTAAWLAVNAYGDLSPDRAPHEPLAEALRGLAGSTNSPAELAFAALVDSAVLGADLATRAPFVHAVADALTTLRSGGLQAALSALT